MSSSASPSTSASTGTGTHTHTHTHHIGKKEKASKKHVIIAGSVAGVVSRFVIAPLDVVKIRLQLQHHSPTTLTLSSLQQTLSTSQNATASNGTLKPGPVYSGLLPTVRTILLEEGITGLWKGNIPAELLYLTYGASQFLIYRQVTRIVTKSGIDMPDPLKNGISGATAGAVATSLTYPFDILRTRFASQGNEKVYKSILYSIKHIYQNEGPRGFFRGLGAGVIQIIPYMGIFFCTYETSRDILTNHHTAMPASWPDAISGTVAAVVAKTAVFPFDLIRKRLQVQGPTRQLYIHRNIPVYNGIRHCASSTVKREGFRGLYKGLTVSLIKAAPASAATMWTFEQTMRLLKWWDGVDS